MKYITSKYGPLACAVGAFVALTFHPARALSQSKLDLHYGLACTCTTSGRAIGGPSTDSPLIKSLSVGDGSSSASMDVSNTYAASQLTASCSANGFASFSGIARFWSGHPDTDMVSKTVDLLTITSPTLPPGTIVPVQVTCSNMSILGQDFSGSPGPSDTAGCTNSETLLVTATNGATLATASADLGEFPAGTSGDTNISNSTSVIVTQLSVGSTFAIINELFASGSAQVAHGDAAEWDISENLTSIIYVNVLTPGADYTAASGTVYPALPTGPFLSIRHSVGQNLFISWLDPSGTYALEKNPDLNPAHWTPNTNSVAVTNGTNQVVVTPSSAKMFFRLTTTNH